MNGFNAYWMYFVVKHVNFKSLNELNEKNLYKNIAERNWPTVKAKPLFANIEKTVSSRKELLFLNLYYYQKNSDYFIDGIIDDGFELYKKRSYELNNLEKTFITDLTYLSEIDTLKNICLNGNIPKIFNYNVSPFTICLLDSLFKFSDKLVSKDISVLEKKKAKSIKKVLDKFGIIFYNRLHRIDVKQLLKEI